MLEGAGEVSRGPHEPHPASILFAAAWLVACSRRKLCTDSGVGARPGEAEKVVAPRCLAL